MPPPGENRRLAAASKASGKVGQMVRKTTLDNGITLVTEQIPEFRSCSLGIWAQSGSRHEREDQSGLSHFLEHMLFKGTPRRTATQIAEAMDGVGGQLNAFTEKEQTCYYARVMDQHLPRALDILSDMFLNSLFDPAELEREKGVILEEIKMYEDAPDEMVFDVFTSSVWDGHPLGRPILGSREVISGLDRERLVQFMEERYLPSRLLVSAAGHVDHDMVAEKVGQWFQGGRPAEPLPLVPGGTPESNPRRIVQYRDSEQVYVCYGVQGLAVTDERRYAMLVLDSVLGGSMSCRLFQEIRERRGLVYTVCTFQNTYRDCGLFGVYAGTSAEKVEEVLRLSREILEEVRQDGIRPEELERAREHLKGSIALAMESTSHRMMRLARTQSFHGRIIPLEEVIERVDAVSHEDILDLARTLLAPERFTLAVLGPVQAVDGVPAVGTP